MALYATIAFVIITHIIFLIKEKKVLIFCDNNNITICNLVKTIFCTALYFAIIYIYACIAIAIFGLLLLTIIGVPLVIVCIIMWITGG